MFSTLEKIAQTDPKYADTVLSENYAAFQNSLYDLANVVPTLAKFYHQASKSYEQACTCHINMIIYFQFKKLFQFGRKIEDLMYTITPEEIPFQLGLSKMDLRKMIKSSLSGKEFPDKYESFAQLVAKIYPNETEPSVAGMREHLASL